MTVRRTGLSVRMRLTLSYAGFLFVSVALLLAVVWTFLLRYVPDGVINTTAGFVPNRSDLLRAFVPAAGVALPFLLAFGLVGGWFLAGHTLAPLRPITEAARRAGSGSLSHRIRLQGPQDEFRELADAFDLMLERLEGHLAESQRFAANASHELRTPLAISRTILDVARRDPEPDTGALIERLSTVNARATAMTEALLLLSRADRRGFAREALDLSLMAEAAVEDLLPLAARRGVRIDSRSRQARTTGSHALLSQMTTNLVHNAIVHNLPTGGVVMVSVARSNAMVELVVENTGAVVAPELAATLTEPFQRAAGRSRGGDDDYVGTGLGLAIVRSIAEAHEGRLRIEPRTGGGLVVTVRLPAAREAPAAT